MLNKEARLCNSLVGIKSVLMELGVEDIKNEVTKNGETETINCFNEIERFIIEYITNSIQSYKFEELKEGMWVWDDEYKQCIKIKLVFMPCKEYQKGSLKIYHNLNEDNDLDFVEFEPNRFYPLVKAMYREE